MLQLLHEVSYLFLDLQQNLLEGRLGSESRQLYHTCMQVYSSHIHTQWAMKDH